MFAQRKFEWVASCFDKYNTILKRLTTHRFFRTYYFQAFCVFSSNKTDIPKADAIVYHNRDFAANRYVNDSTKLHIIFTQESQCNEKMTIGPGIQITRTGNQSFSDRINWTMTFRHDSEIYAPYGNIKKRSESEFIKGNVSRKSHARIFRNFQWFYSIVVIKSFRD